MPDKIKVISHFEIIDFLRMIAGGILPKGKYVAHFIKQKKWSAFDNSAGDCLITTYDDKASAMKHLGWDGNENLDDM